MDIPRRPGSLATQARRCWPCCEMPQTGKLLVTDPAQEDMQAPDGGAGHPEAPRGPFLPLRCCGIAGLQEARTMVWRRVW